MVSKAKHLLTTATFLMMLLGLSFTLCTSCGDDKDDRDGGSLTLKAGETHNIGTGSNWKSANPLIASVEDQTITAECVGSTTITGSAGTIKVTVKATRFDFTEPYLSFGASKSDVKNAMSSYTLTTDKSTTIGYQGKGKVYMYGYGFKNNQLSMSLLIVKSTYANDLTKFLSERYFPVYVDKDNYRVGMVDPLKKIAVLVEPEVISYTTYLTVAYVKYTGSSSIAIKKMKAFGSKPSASNEETAKIFDQLKSELVKQ